MIVALSVPAARWFVFLVRDDGPRPREAKVLESMQEAHIANFKRRYAEGKLVTAGPVNDPSKHRRGIVVLSVGTREEALALFDTDPYVRGHMMRVEAHRWAVAPKGFAVPPDPNAMAEYRVVRIAIKGSAPFPTLPGGVGGVFAGERIGVILTSSVDERAIRRALDASPAVQEGATYDVLPLYLSAGTLG